MIIKAIEAKKIKSAHDCADGGLFITLMESGLPNELGFDIKSTAGIRKDAFLFGEAQSRVIVSINQESKENFEAWLNTENQSVEFLGTVTSGDYILDEKSMGKGEDFAKIYNTSLEDKLS